MTEEERLREISSRYFSEDEDYFDAGEDVGYLLAVLDKRDQRIKALERLYDACKRRATVDDADEWRQAYYDIDQALAELEETTDESTD